MKLFITRILQGFEYQSPGDWLTSLAPSYKYNIMAVGMGVSAGSTLLETVFGLDYLAFAGLIAVMILELTSGVWASHIRKEEFSSRKLSRFTFKCAVYLTLIAVPYLFSQSFEAKGKELASDIFNWIHIFLVVQIVVENIISILENYAVIQGKDKTHWITKIQNKVDQIFS